MQPAGSKKVGFYGLDLYSLRASMNAVLAYLDKADPNLARLARIRYACFDQFGENGRAYGFLTGAGQAKSCREEAVMTLGCLIRRSRCPVRRLSPIQTTRIAMRSHLMSSRVGNMKQNDRALSRAPYAVR